MNLKTLLIAGLLLSMGMQPAFAQNKEDVNWTPLFNGKNLEGWHQLGGDAEYTVKDGMIIGTTVLNTPNSFLVTDKKYGDFILELEFKLGAPMNSGIQIRSLSSPDYMNGRVHGYQVEIDPSERAWSGGIYDEARRGWLYPLIFNPDARNAFKHNQWNHYRIEAIGNTIRTWVNGEPVASLVDSMTHKGFIGLQVHSIGNNKAEAGRQIRWRNIRIQTGELNPRPYDDTFVVNLIPNTLSRQERAQGYKLLWDGNPAHIDNHWRGLYNSDFPEKGWTTKNGVLKIYRSTGTEAGTGGDIVTRKQYCAFVFQFEFKLTKGANSGVKYFVKESYNLRGEPDVESDGYGVGLEYQILDDKNHPDAKKGRNGNRTLASLYDLIPRNDLNASRPPYIKPIGEWNHGRIIVYPNGHVEHWLNGYQALAYEKGSKHFKHLVEISKYDDFKNFGLWKKGHILLQDHGETVSYRSLKIKPLKKCSKEG